MTKITEGYSPEVKSRLARVFQVESEPPSAAYMEEARRIVSIWGDVTAWAVGGALVLAVATLHPGLDAAFKWLTKISAVAMFLYAGLLARTGLGAARDNPFVELDPKRHARQIEQVASWCDVDPDARAYIAKVEKVGRRLVIAEYLMLRNHISSVDPLMQSPADR